MLLLLVVVLFAGIFAARMIPSYAVQRTRRDAGALREVLTRIRQAFDSQYHVQPSWDPGAVPSSALDELFQRGLLPDGKPIDPTIPPELWNTGSWTWIITENMATHSSFESSDHDSSTGFVASWSAGTPDTFAATDSLFFPSQDSSAFDDYPGQNRLGERLATAGASVLIVR